MNWESVTDVFTLPCVKQIASGNPLYNTGSSAQCFVMAKRIGMGWEEAQEKGDIYIYTHMCVCVCVCVFNWSSLTAQLLRICLQCQRPGFDPWVGKIPWRRTCNPLQYSCLKNPHRQRSLVGYSPWSHKESNMTEQLSTAQHVYNYDWLGVFYSRNQHNIVKQLSSN